MVCGILPDQGSNWCPQNCKVASKPLDHRESDPSTLQLSWMNTWKSVFQIVDWSTDIHIKINFLWVLCNGPSISLHHLSFPASMQNRGRYTKHIQFSSVQSLRRVRLFAFPWTAARQASLSITNSRSSLKLTSIESVMPSSHLIFCRPLLLLPSNTLLVC